MIRDPYVKAGILAVAIAAGVIFGSWLAHAAMSVGAVLPGV